MERFQVPVVMETAEDLNSCLVEGDQEEIRVK